MTYTAKLHNYPLTWPIEANNENDAKIKAREAIKKDMALKAIAGGGFLEIKRNIEDEKQMDKNIYKDIANALIDNYVEIFGIDNAIMLLNDLGCTADELINCVKFDADDVREALG